MRSEPRNTLTEDGVISLFNHPLEDSKLEIETNIILQVIHIKICQQNHESHKEMYTATLSDMIHKYNGFVIIKDPNENALNPGDLINIGVLSPMFTGVQKSLVWIIKKYINIGVQAPIVSSILIKYVNGQVLDPENTRVNISSESNTVKIHQKPKSSSPFENTFQSPIVNEPKINYNVANTINNYDDHYENLIDDDNDYQELDQRTPYTSLKHLTTFSKDFKIFVRVTKKSEKKTFNATSPGKTPGCLFYFIVIDEDGTEMQITCFNKAVQKFFEKIKEKSVYEINGGYIKINDKKFSTIKADYKIVLDENSTIIEMQDTKKIKNQSFDNIKISNILNVPMYSIIDLLGIVIEEGQVVIKNTKNGEQPMKRTSIGDSSGYKIEFTLWRTHASTQLQVGQIIQLKSVKVGEFNGRNISTFDETNIILNPNTKESNDLKAFVSSFNGEYLELPKTSTKLSREESKEEFIKKKSEFIKTVLEDLDDVEDAAGLTKIKATITQVMHNDKNFYGGCNDKNCKKKLIQEYNKWRCPGCNKDYDRPTYYYTLSVRVKDCSMEHWIDIFGKTAEYLLKMTAEQYKEILHNKQIEVLRELSKFVEFKTFYFLIKPKMQNYNTVVKKKLYAYKIENVDHKEEAKQMLRQLKQIL